MGSELEGYLRGSIMNLTRIGALLVRLGLLVTVGCASYPPFPASSITGGLFEVKINETLAPKVVTAKRGDEVKWINTTNGPVDISFEQTQENLISCQRGFVSPGWGYLFGSSGQEILVAATVHPNESASLCFSIPGTYPDAVRTKAATADHATRLAGSITIE